ncbi:UDP-3-O-(3-hydroxymyristoyl)glucosamine N-acyltransferase [Oxalicibacterium faecigallinarum]|uniref:UDP-3-O-(3-hydroxymyristoyl)glucosamine N-acyltransferase n=1 Tax=Oxalicibacterium faecigallinarum TaxID=573741 RepID=A0A8J3AZU2_9BURK|nr:UDP-3-O-(3-hydroxymyristoyl)glucosamine N-acyltransferase [Oxalicibacterium faecigallinarum]GGI20998.1 hypothetical protein GCM10008066_26810 [Oxalicibacterium faecigallinarum]
MECKWVIGASDYLDIVYDACCQARPDLTIEKVFIPQNSDYSFDLAAIQHLSPGDGLAFVAFDERFGNFKRTELMRAVAERGISLATFISPRSLVAANVRIGPNVFVGDGAVIGHGTQIEYNTVIHPGAQIGSGSKIKSSCWIEQGVQVGSNVEIGTHCTIRMGAVLRNGITIGRTCELGWPQLYASDISNKTIYDLRYDQPIHTYGN